MLIRLIKIAGIVVSFVFVFGISAYLTIVWIIKSENTIIVPELVGKDVVYVLELMSNLGLNTKVKGSEYNPDIPKNHVIFQEPVPGAEIKKGRDIRIIISKGAKTLLAPNVIGLSVRQARIIVEENDLQPGIVSRTYHGRFKKDEVISQFPPPSVMINRGEKIDFLVSMGKMPGSYMMPDLIGLSLDEAVRKIENFNLVLGKLNSGFRNDKPQNTVIIQEPTMGHQILEENSVNLVLNKKPGSRGKEILNASSGVHLFRYHLEDGFLKKHIRVQMNIYGVSFELFNDFIKPGKEIRLLIPTNSEAKILLYEDGELVKTETYNP
jgi:serine/threonine-protein kinase